jgi:hypothetical protein
MGGSTAVELIITVVIRPNAVTSRSQYVSVEDSKSESKKDIQILRTNRLNRVGWESLNELLSYWFHIEGFNS